MQPNPSNLLDIAQISTPLVGFYDTPDKSGFEPFEEVEFCIFSCYQAWMKGKNTCLSTETVGTIGCPGAGYWNCNVATMQKERVAYYLAEEEGLKESQDLMCQWLINQQPYEREQEYIIIGPLRDDQYDYLRTITFFVNPDQLSLLITGAEYGNASPDHHPVQAVFGSGCGQLAAVFKDFDVPKAMIGGTDLAMRSYLPRDILAFTVTKPMFEQLCRLDKNSFLYKSYWKKIMSVRKF